MKKIASSSLLILALFFSVPALPLLAQDAQNNSSAEEKSSAGDNVTKLKDPIKTPSLKKRSNNDSGSPSKSNHSDVAIPVRMASFTTGMLFGTPVSVVRAFGRQTRDYSKEIIGDSRNPVLLTATYLFNVPFAAAGAPIEGVVMSVANSWKGSGTEPFGKETFSMQPSEE